jgi:hypothetical protein
MIMRMIALAAALAGASPAWGEVRGGDLLAACNSPPGSQGDVLCGAYINGYSNGVLGDQVAKEHGEPICITDHTNTLEIRLMVRSFLELHPELLTVDLGGVVARAMASAYPCPK